MFEALASPLQLLLLQEKVVPTQAETDEVRGAWIILNQEELRRGEVGIY
jgi:hypothetical protein